MIDSVEVSKLSKSTLKRVSLMDIDRNTHLHCHGEGHAVGMACTAKSAQPRDPEMGSMHNGSTYLDRRLPDVTKYHQNTLRFITEEASSVHGNVRVSSLFTSESGEWKIGGFEILSSMKEDDAVIYVGERPGYR